VQESGIRLRNDNPFDSVQISIFDDRSTSYSFYNEGFIDFVNEVASKVMVIKK
jgi:ABC-type oligopeptide transport system substrate-binding subunit